jgi:hypothetical protein
MTRYSSAFIGKPLSRPDPPSMDRVEPAEGVNRAGKGARGGFNAVLAKR